MNPSVFTYNQCYPVHIQSIILGIASISQEKEERHPAPEVVWMAFFALCFIRGKGLVVYPVRRVFRGSG